MMQRAGRRCRIFEGQSLPTPQREVGVQSLPGKSVTRDPRSIIGPTKEKL